MRPAGKGLHDSLYFTYPHFDCPPVPAPSDLQTPVIIAGAGPIGMTAALTLARYGIASVLLDRKETFNDGSRAICIARPSMQIFDQIGAIKPFLDKALGWQCGRSYYRDQMIYRLEMQHPQSEKYLPMYNLQQQYIEAFLHDAVAKEPLIQMRWQNEVAAVRQQNDGVAVDISSPAGNFSLNGQYLLAADGARSPIRSMLKLRLRGENYEGKYVIADIRMKSDFPTERRAFFHPASNPEGTLLIHKQPDDIWRIDYQLREGESEDEAMREESIRKNVEAVLVDIGHTDDYELEWWSIYAANTLLLDEYRHGKIFFIGDSAHIVPIFGVRGLNNGLADAFNIGWKLGYVLNDKAGDALLDSYTPERRGATLDVFANATKSTRFMTPPTRGWALMRKAALSLATKHPFAAAFANPRQMQPYTYADSPISMDRAADANFGQGPITGAAAPNVRLPERRWLLDVAGKGFTLVVCGREQPEWTALCKPHDPDFTQLTVEPSSEAAALYALEAGDAILLRPDLHIAGRLRQPTLKAIEALMARSLGAAL